MIRPNKWVNLKSNGLNKHCVVCNVLVGLTSTLYTVGLLSLWSLLLANAAVLTSNRHQCLFVLGHQRTHLCPIKLLRSSSELRYEGKLPIEKAKRPPLPKRTILNNETLIAEKR